MTNRKRTLKTLNHALMHQERGAALLIALLLTLVLTAIGIVAIESTVRSMRGASNYRLRRQATMASQSAITYVSNRVGQKASVYWGEMNRQEYVSTLNGNGGYIKLNPQTYQNPDAFDQIQTGETGLFSSNGAPRSHESQYRLSDYRVIIRDPIDGPPAVGNSKFCFKKVLFASQVTYVASGTVCQTNAGCGTDGICNQPEPGVDGVCIRWGDPTNAAWGASGVEALIGPIACE